MPFPFSITLYNNHQSLCYIFDRSVSSTFRIYEITKYKNITKATNKIVTKITVLIFAIFFFSETFGVAFFSKSSLFFLVMTSLLKSKFIALPLLYFDVSSCLLIISRKIFTPFFVRSFVSSLLASKILSIACDGSKE